MGNDDIREIVRLRAVLKLALLRAKCLWFTYERPDAVCRNRTTSAYDAGYEAGWRGWPYNNTYSRTHYQSAYRLGYSDATTQLHAEATAKKGKKETNDEQD
jgi:hypothetical protein